MNDEKSLMQCKYSNHATKQNAQCICKGIGIAKDNNGLSRPKDFSILLIQSKVSVQKGKGKTA